MFFKKFCLSVKFFFRSLGKSFFIRRLHTKTILILNIRIIFFDELSIILLGFGLFQSLFPKIWQGSKLPPRKRIFPNTVSRILYFSDLSLRRSTPEFSEKTLKHSFFMFLLAFLMFVFSILNSPLLFLKLVFQSRIFVIDFNSFFGFFDVEKVENGRF